MTITPAPHMTEPQFKAKWNSYTGTHADQERDRANYLRDVVGPNKVVITALMHELMALEKNYLIMLVVQAVPHVIGAGCIRGLMKLDKTVLSYIILGI